MNLSRGNGVCLAGEELNTSAIMEACVPLRGSLVEGKGSRPRLGEVKKNIIPGKLWLWPAKATVGTQQ